MMKNERIVFADWLRAISCFLVMLVHASENFYGSDFVGSAACYSELANESNRFWVSLYDGGIARSCVPLFMMVSAFLLVPMKQGVTMGQFYRRRFLRVLPPFLLFLVLYCFLPLLWGGMSWEQSMGDIRLIPFSFPSMAGHLWFMYPLIGLYLFIPVVSPWLEKASARDERTFLWLFLASTFVPYVHAFCYPEFLGECFWNEFDSLWYFSGFLGYLVLAHYVRHHLLWSRSKRMGVGAVCFLLGAIVTAVGFWLQGVPGQVIATPVIELTWGFCTPNVALATFGAFLLFTCIEQPRAPRLVAEISRLSFGMYLMHMFFLAPISGYFLQGDPANPILPVWLSIPCIAALSYICCVITTKLISLLPGSKWIVGC